MKKTILVTGGAGYIGSACVAELHRQGHEVVVFDNLSTGQAQALPKDVPVTIGDITDKEALRQLCQQYNFSAVVHCAAKKAVGESEQNPSLYFNTNLLGSLNVLSIMEEFSIPQIIFSSTAAVYAPPRNLKAVIEDSPLEPVNVYGHSKLMVEQLIREYARLGKIKQYTIFRYFNVAGDAGLLYQERNAQNVFPLLASAITSGQTFYIFGADYETKDGTGVRDYIHLNDLVRAHLLALAGEVSGIFNLGSGSGFSVRELINEFEAASGLKLQAEIAPRRAGDPASLIAESSLAQQQLHWQPKSTLKDMVESTLAAYTPPNL